MITKDKVINIFCIADDFCKEYEKEIQEHQLAASSVDATRKKRNRKSNLSTSEIITILICYHTGTFRCFKHYYLHYIKIHMKDEFPDAVSYNRFIELQARVITPFMLFLKLTCFGECTGITYIDSTPIRVCHNKRISRNKTFKDIAKRGKSTMGWFYGFKLHLICNEKGELLNFSLTKGNVDDRNTEVFNELSKNLFGKLYADKGYISKTLFETLFCDGIHIVTGIKSNMKNVLFTLRDKILLRKRSVIETINDELKNIGNIEHSRHRSFNNFLMNILAALIAYCFQPKKPAIKFKMEEDQGQLRLFM